MSQTEIPRQATTAVNGHGAVATFAPIATHSIPWRALFTSLLGLGPIPFTMVFFALELVAEQNRRIRQHRAPEVLSHMERTSRERGEKKANGRVRDRAEKKLRPIAETVLSLTTKITVLEQQIELIEGDPLVGPHGEQLTFAQTREAHDKGLKQVSDDEAADATRHRRLTPGLRKRARGIILIDFPIMLLFFAVVLNVDTSDPLTTPVASGAALIFALFGTIGVAFGLHFLGERHRAHKNAKSQWTVGRGARVQPVLELLVVLALLALLGALMAYRIVTEAEDAGASTGLGWTLGVLFGLITALVNYVVYAVEYYDGSTITEQLDRHAVNLYMITHTQQQLKAQVQLLRAEKKRQQALGHHEAAGIRHEATHLVVAGRADRTIRYTRSVHQGTGPTGELPTPQIDFSPVEATLHPLDWPELVPTPQADTTVGER